MRQQGHDDHRTLDTEEQRHHRNRHLWETEPGQPLDERAGDDHGDLQGHVHLSAREPVSGNTLPAATSAVSSTAQVPSAATSGPMCS